MNPKDSPHRAHLARLEALLANEAYPSCPDILLSFPYIRLWCEYGKEVRDAYSVFEHLISRVK